MQEITPGPHALYAATAPWSGLSGVPAGFADNTDNDTQYTVSGGSGLTLGGTGNTMLSTDSNILQKRVSGSCHVGSMIRVVNANGTVVCEEDGPLNRAVPPQFGSNYFTGLALGNSNSVSIGTDGLPRIFFSDLGSNEYKLLRCLDATCSSTTTRRIDDFGAAGNDYGALAIDPSGFPVMSYYDPNASAGAFNFARCSDINCTSVVTTTINASMPSMGKQNDITINSTGFPIMVYYNPTNGPNIGRLNMAACSDPTCTSGVTNSVLAAGIVSDPNPSIILGADGLALIAYDNQLSGDLVIAHCSDVPCAFNTVVSGGTPQIDGFEPAITTGADGLGLVVYWGAQPFEPLQSALYTAHCSDTICSAVKISMIYAPLSVPPEPNGGVLPAVTIGQYGLGFISFLDMLPGGPSIILADCNDLACSSATIYPRYNGNSPSALTIQTNGYPFVTYKNPTGLLSSVACTNPFCVDYFRWR